jgi:NAD(P)-dependent dehydrogenase (short-subunit alcohol dehydrogenase family)
VHGRRVLVTGAGQGVGRGIARAFAAAGAEVAVNDVDPARAAAVADETGGVPAVFDVTDLAAVSAAVAALGGVDVLVNNAGNAGTAGFGALGTFADSDPADWEPFLRVNLYGVLHCTRAVLPEMIGRGWGRVVTIVSDAGRTGSPGLAVYGAAKAGAGALMRSVAAETGRHGVTANAVALGTMRTEATEPLWADPDNPRAAAVLRGYPIRRPGRPEDVGPLVVFLAGEDASWITGQTIPVNGGLSSAL